MVPQFSQSNFQVVPSFPVRFHQNDLVQIILCGIDDGHVLRPQSAKFFYRCYERIILRRAQ